MPLKELRKQSIEKEVLTFTILMCVDEGKLNVLLFTKQCFVLGISPDIYSSPNNSQDNASPLYSSFNIGLKILKSPHS